MKKRTVFLFGAGAVIPWGGPTTPELTNLVRTSGFKLVGKDQYITDWIYQQLISGGIPDKYINFETILNVIEELIVYHSPFDWVDKTPPLLKEFLSREVTNDIFNYSIKGGELKHGFQLEIPKYTEYNYSDFAYHHQLPHQFFLQHLLRDLLNEICLTASRYTYHSDTVQLKTADSEISHHFVEWMNAIAEQSSLRMFTLNYDNIFKTLMSLNGVEVFDGFYPPINNHPFNRADVRKIWTDNDGHIHYNLHGSVYWEVEQTDRHQLPNPEFFRAKYPQMHLKQGVPFTQVEKGKTILISNIVTGYQKAQRSAITPLKQMQAVFDRDCCFADTIYLIGYSLGDEHINESIKTALRHNPNLKLTIVDPGFLNDTQFQFGIRLMPFYEGHVIQPRTIEPNFSHKVYSNNITVYSIRFEEFLRLQSNPVERDRVNI